MTEGECQCPDAQKWRAYWTPAAIAERLSAELDRARRAAYDGWWSDIDAASEAFRNAPRPKLHNVPSFAELERRRRE